MAARSVLVIGAGMGGLTAALRLARAGLAVRVVEARPGPGGLAAGLELAGLSFDAGPYILLDRPGLEWAFRAVGLELAEHVPLQRIDDIYEVLTPDGNRVHFRASLEETAAGFDRQWPGSGPRYVGHVKRIAEIYRRLEPLQRMSRPGLWELIRGGGWRHLPFLFRSLGGVLARTGLPQPVCDALAIWTHIAGQRIEEAPSPLAFVPALLHGVGAFYPAGGIGRIPNTLAAAAERAGVVFDYGVKVTAIRRCDGRAALVETAGSHEEKRETLRFDAILSNAAGIGTYVDLLENPPAALRTRLEQLPLQSPGVAAYLAVKLHDTVGTNRSRIRQNAGEAAANVTRILANAATKHEAANADNRPSYLRFFLPGGDERCRCLVMPAVLEPNVQRDGWYPARLIVPMDHARAQQAGPAGQRQYLERVLAEPWWREHVHEYRVLATRIPAEWGAQYQLYRDSMNPVMTARFMRAGRLAHRSPDVPGLYLAGSATHPGQWLSFCAISGILAADSLLEDLR